MFEGMSLIGHLALYFWVAVMIAYFLALGFIDH